MVKTLKVILWDEEVGRLSWDDKRQMSYFTYNPTFVHRGIDISPLWASIRNNRGLMPIWGEEQRIYQKLPAFLADSLPDSWGNRCLIFGDSRIISPIRKFLLLISCHLSVEEEWVLWSLSQSMRGVRNQRGLMSIPWLHLLNAYLLNERRLRFYQRNLLPCSRS